MKLLLRLFLFLVLLGIIIIFFLWYTGSKKIDAVVWQPAPFPGLQNEFEPNETLSRAKHILNGKGVGPEDIASDGLGWFYTGYADGRIVRFDSQGSVEEFVNTGGRPLGMQFDARGNLIVADAYKGLLSVNSNKNIQVLTDSVDGVKLKFTDDLDIADDGTIWFSDASRNFNFETNFYNFLEGSATGRLLSYSPNSQKTTVHIDNLFFANGVALGPQDEFVLVNETGTGRIHRLWLKGEEKGQRDIFYDGLAGNPDNLSFNGVDTFWVALPAVRLKVIEDLASKPFVRTILAGLPLSLLLAGNHYGFVIGLDLDGKLKHNFQDPKGHCSSITSVNQFEGYLFLGSFNMSSACVFELP